LEKADSSFTSADLRERHADRVWRLRHKGGTKGWFYLYLLLEFQSTPDPFMAVRLLGYLALLLADLVRTKVATPALGLPPVLSIVLYNGKRPWGAPTDLGSLFRAVPPGSERYLPQPQLAYLLIDENRLRPQEMALPGNRVATLFRLETCAPKELPDLTAELAASLRQGEESDLRDAFTVWLRELLRRLRLGVTIPQVGDLEETAMLEETLREWVNGAKREGQTEGKRQLLMQLLEQRFGTLPREVRRRVETMTEAST
jgi:hypothetical protein